MTPRSTQSTVMTIGVLSRRTGVPVKALREYEDLGLIYTVGRSAGNYRLFDDEALWCVAVIGILRGLGLTLAEIGDLTASYLQRPAEPVGPRLAEVLGAVRARTEDKIAELGELLTRSMTTRRSSPTSSPAGPTSASWTRISGPADLDSPPRGRP